MVFGRARSGPSRRWPAPAAGALIVALLSSALVRANAAPAPDPSARIAGPVVGGLHGRPYGTSLVDLRRWGYVEREYFASGTALGGGGSAIPTPNLSGGPAAYRTRILVRRPADTATFNGTVLVEWLNVTSSQDYDADWSEGYREILRGGYAYVAVSVQQVGVQSLKDWDGLRYGTLQHPGDGYADSIYAQVLEAIRRPNGVDPFVGLRVRHVIADGHSQSGINLHAFVDQVQSNTHLADGFLIRGDGTTNFDLARLRTPVLQYQSEAELDGPIASLQRYGRPESPAPDSTFYRLWQVAGSTHTGSEGADYLLGAVRRDDFGQSVAWDERAEGGFDGQGAPTCESSVGTGPLDQFPQWYTLDAAIHALNRWVVTGRAPGMAPRVGVDGQGHVRRDRYGNALGGVRNPVVDVPVATYHGDEGCPLSGVTKALDARALADRYRGHAGYVAAMRAAISQASAAGWLLGYDAVDEAARAERSTAGS